METPVENFNLGFGVNSPFGLSSKWSSVGNFQYLAFFTELKTSAYTASGAYEISDKWSIGGGFTMMEAKLQQNGKFNSTFLVGDPGDSDFEIDVEGEGYGYNLGLLYTPNEQHALGLFYRSQLKARLDGKLSSDRLGTLMGATFGTNGGTTHVSGADTDYKFPANITAGYQYSPTENLDVEFDLGWTDWSSYDSFDINFSDSNAVLDGFKQFSKDYSDTYSFHTGMSYDLNEAWTMLGGYFFYQRAANENNYRNENPDGHKHGFSFGFEFSQDNWTWDVMYEGIVSLTETIENTEGGTNGADIDGKYSGYTQIVTTGLRHRF